jgi:hypothetical protein
MAKDKLKAQFIEPMFLLRTGKLPEGPGWLQELIRWLSRSRHQDPAAG